jgi:hypothetical protein
MLKHGSKQKDATTIIPSQIIYDKEELYEDNIRLRNQTNKLQE